MSGEDSSEMEAYKREATKRLAKIEKFDTVNLSVMQVAEECLKATIADKQLDMAFAGSFMAYVFHMPRIEAFDSIVEILNRITQSAVFNMGISVAKSIVSSSMREPYAKKVKRTSAFLSRCICKLLDGDGGENKRSDLVIKYIRREDFIDKLKKFSSFAVDELVQSVAHLPSDAGFLNVYPDCFRDPTDCFRDPTDGTIFEQRWAIKSAFKNLTVENSRTISKTRKDRKQDVRNSLPAAIGNVAPNTHDNRKEGGSDLHHGNRIHSESEHLPQRTIVFSGGSGDVQERSPGARDRSDSRDRTRRDSDRLQHSGHSARDSNILGTVHAAAPIRATALAVTRTDSNILGTAHAAAPVLATALVVLIPATASCPATPSKAGTTDEFDLTTRRGMSCA
eukprot:gene10937-12761_t